MKELKEILTEGVFDKNLVEKDPIDMEYFKIKNPAERYNIFYVLYVVGWTPENQIPDWIIEEYRDHQTGYDYILDELSRASRKIGRDTWFNINTWDFEGMGDEMTEDEIDEANEELKKFFSKASSTDRGGYFMVCHGKIPKFLLKIFKDTDILEVRGMNVIENIKDWAVEYYNEGGEQELTFYGCPKGLDPTVKKLLYGK